MLKYAIILEQERKYTMKIKLTSINSKLVAGMTAFTLITTSMTGCSKSTPENRFVYTENEKGEYICSNSLKNRYIDDYYVVITKVYNKYSINLGRRKSSMNGITYFDVFSNTGIIYQAYGAEFKNVEANTIPLTEFLIYYNGLVKEEYTEEELKEIYNQILNDFKLDEENKKLVLKK